MSVLAMLDGGITVAGSVMVPPYASAPTPYSCVTVDQNVEATIFCAKSWSGATYG